MEERQKYKKHNPIYTGEFGKMPPQNVELESVILGAILLEKEALEKIIDFLKPEMFYKEAHQKIFECCVKLYKKSSPIDILTVIEELKKIEQIDVVGGPYFVTMLTENVASSYHIKYHAKIVQQKFIQRELIRFSSEIQERSFDETEDVADILSEAEKQLSDIVSGTITRDFKSIDQLITEKIDQYQKISENKGELKGLPTGFTTLDRITNGFNSPDLIIVAARPSMGKTAFALSIARNMAVEFNIPVGIFSLEMSDLQIANRLINQELSVTEKQITNNFERCFIEEKLESFRNAGIFIDDTPSLSMVQFKSKARRMYAKHHIQAIFFDYIQLATATTDNKQGINRDQEIGLITRTLKAIAKELNIPVIAMAQLSREVEKRANKKPLLSDLRESGNIEQDADIVSFLFRPEYYGIKKFDDDETDCEGACEVIIAKHRNGGLGSVYLTFVNELAKFEDYKPMPKF